MKILLLGDASNYHNALGKGLSRLGHDVTIASDGSRWMDTERHIDLSRRKNKIGGALLWARLNTVLSSKLKGYDVVQLVNPVFVNLRIERVAPLFRRLKRDNGALYLTALGTDTAYVQMAMADDCPLRYTEFRVGKNLTPFGENSPEIIKAWLSDPLLSHCRMIYDNIDGAITALYEYQLAMERVMPRDKIAYGGIPVDTEQIALVASKPLTDRRIIVLAPYHKGREHEKGVDILHEIARSVPDIDFQPVTGLRFADFERRLDDCDVVLDQIYSYTPATTALMAMAKGKTVVTGAEPEFESFVGEKVPAINVSPLDHEGFRNALISMRDGRGLILPEDARNFVVRNNDAKVVAQRFVDFWTR